MTHLPEIWQCIRSRMQRGKWVGLEEIYGLVESCVTLDAEDQLPQSPSSGIPKWKRNTRNVLQYRKTTGEIHWDGNARYKL